MISEKFYLFRLFKCSKGLFTVAVLFIFLNIAANFIYKAEHTPLFKWDLYSNRVPAQKVYSFLEIRYNDSVIVLFPHTWDEPKKLFFTNTLQYFISMKRNDDMDPFKTYIDTWNTHHPFFKKILPGLKFYNDTTELNRFAAWYKRYLEQHVKKRIDKIDIYEVKVAWLATGEVKKLSAALIYKLL